MEVIVDKAARAVVFLHPHREPIIIYDYNEIVKISVTLIEALRVLEHG